MAIKKNIYIDQGADHTEIFNLEILTDQTKPYDPTTNPYIPLDLSTFSAKMEIKQTYDSTALLTLTDTSGITLSSNGIVTIDILGSQSLSAFIFSGKCAKYVYDLYLVDSVAIKPVYGDFHVNKLISQ